ncbi:hypothetical protein [Halalkalibacterium halodurans]|uniref:Uncharacterized protein n=1 Tax=Halalkalibacterium halodurans TaxID=86665 RepID=A0A0M0KNA5_ALKHA|nr:hypothetical protein [Halalkalibacterium halodurans]TPE70692.1 hypothetical protein AMD02_001625 [Halalkalibacterium halodurans]
MSDYETGRTIKELENEKDYKSVRLWGKLFWFMPLSLTAAAMHLLGPWLGLLAISPVIALCCFYKTRIYMYYFVSIGALIVGFMNGGIIGGVIFGLVIIIGCLANYRYVKYKIAAKTYEQGLHENKNEAP